jgi:hypothetical protein
MPISIPEALKETCFQLLDFIERRAAMAYGLPGVAIPWTDLPEHLQAQEFLEFCQANRLLTRSNLPGQVDKPVPLAETFWQLGSDGRDWLVEQRALVRAGQGNNRMSNIPGRITAPDEMLRPAIAELLRRTPETWQTYRPDDLTEIQAQALFLLTAAGMVERRERLRQRMFNHPLVAEATITFTGEYGGVEALKDLAASMWPDWQDAFREWKKGDAANMPSGICERLEPSEWRLTDQGVIARKDLDSDTEAQSAIFNFVLRRGLFDGLPHLLPDGRIIQHGVRGKGQLVTMKKTKAEPAAPATVNVGNWKDGGDAFAQAFGPVIAKVFETMQAQVEQATAKAAAADAGNNRKKPAKAEVRAWTQEDLDKAIDEYKAQRAAAYKELADAVRMGRHGAKKKAKTIYGRNAIARALGVKSPSMVSKSPAWIAIAEDLRLELHRERTAQGTRRTVKAGRIGLDLAVEQKSKDADEGADNAPAESPLETAERQETLRQINRLAQAGKTPKDRAKNEEAADALTQKLQRGDISDDQARQVVEMALNPSK